MIFKTKSNGLDSASKRTFARCLSVAGKDRIILEAARDPNSYDGGIIEVILKTQLSLYDEWEADTTVFDERLLENEEYRRSIGIADVGICARIAGGKNGTSLYLKDRFHHYLFANLRPELTILARKVYADYPNIDVVLSMLLRGRGIGSIGKNLYLLLNGDVGKIQEALSKSMAKQEYQDRIMAAVADYAKGPGRTVDVGVAQQRLRFMRNFDYEAAERSLPFAATAFRDTLKSLVVPESDEDRGAFELRIRYMDGEIGRHVTISKKHAPVYMIKEMFKTVKESFELVTEVGNLQAASAIGELQLPDTLTVRVLNQPKEIVGQLRIIFQLIKQGSEQ